MEALGSGGTRNLGFASGLGFLVWGLGCFGFEGSGSKACPGHSLDLLAERTLDAYSVPVA